MKRNIFWMILVLSMAFVSCGNDDDVKPKPDAGDTTVDDDDDNNDISTDDDTDAGDNDDDVDTDDDDNDDDDDDNDVVDDDDDDATCIPSKEVCDNKDNDCDGEIDEDTALEMGCDNDIFCDGVEVCLQGQCVIEEEVDCSYLDDQCNDGVCDEDTHGCKTVPKDNGTLCDADGDGCTENDYCQDGVCITGEVVDCSKAVEEKDKCNVGICESAGNNEYVCNVKAKPDGISCSDEFYCNGEETCQAGVCKKGEDVDCSELNNKCLVGQCNESMDECIAIPAENEMPCNADSDGCTVNDSCIDGECVAGLPANCSGTNDECNTGVCQKIIDDPDNYVCVPVAKPNFTTLCNADSDGCTQNDFCLNGNCLAGDEPDCSEANDQCNDGICENTGYNSYSCIPSPVENDTRCNADDDGCTKNDYCQAGICKRGAKVDCSYKDDDCNDGECKSTGDNSSKCIAEPKSDGRSCDDGEWCTIDDECQDGDCEGTVRECLTEEEKKCNTAICDEVADACIISNKTNGIVCDDELYCTDGDECLDGVCTGGPARDCSSFDDQCNEGLCDEIEDTCYSNPINEGLSCDDGDSCTTSETCQSGSCDGIVNLDVDNDFYVPETCACNADCEGLGLQGGDCNDGEITINPGATDLLDTVDQNCDGFDGTSEYAGWDWGKYLSISLDNTEEVYILKGPRIFTKKTGVWENESCDSNGGSYSNMAIDSANTIHTSYRSIDGLRYAKKVEGGSWEITLVDTDDPETGRGTSIALDSSGYPWIAYRGFDGSLRIAKWNGTSWDKQVVDTGWITSGTSLVIQGNLSRIAYWKDNGTDLALWLAEETSPGVFVKNKIDIYDTGEYCSMAEDSLGNLFISSGYFSGSSSCLRLTDDSGGSFSGQCLDSGDPAEKGWSTSIAVDGDGKVHIVYVDASIDGTSGVYYMTNKSGSWIRGRIGRYSSKDEFITAITIDSLNNPHIAYYGAGVYCSGLCYAY